MTLSTRICDLCDGVAEPRLEEYRSTYLDKVGKEIIVPEVAIFHCTNPECGHIWLPIDQEKKIDRYVENERRFYLEDVDIALIRDSLPFDTKKEAADFLCLNEKAFTKWENGYTEPNKAYDLLLRLAVFSKKNFNFIKHLHSTAFRFERTDYELVCEKLSLAWNFEVLTNSQFNDDLPDIYETEIPSNMTLIEVNPEGELAA